MDPAEAKVYAEQIANGKSVEYAKAFASKINEGEVFARHFAVIRERRYLAKVSANDMVSIQSQGGERKLVLAPLEASMASLTVGARKASDGGAPSNVDSIADDGVSMRKRTPQDFVFTKTIGEGSFGSVFLSVEKDNQRNVAIKVLEKAHIRKEKKEKYVSIEKDVFNMLNFSPYIIKLFYTFQDPAKLYFVIEYASNGELLKWINKLGCFDETVTQFYAAQILMALDHMHGVGVIHRDLKPENILLDQRMHVKVTDFGTAAVLSQEGSARANSFVGTAQYVSPELLTDKKACKSSDLWALGCIVYQLLAGQVPFRGGNEYQTFKKITALEYEIPEGFPAKGKSLVLSLLKLDPTERLGSDTQGSHAALKAHAFFEGVDWPSLHTITAPKLDAYLPARSATDQPLHACDDTTDELADLIAAAYRERTGSVDVRRKRDDERQELLASQKSSPWHPFVDAGELILKSGLVDKRKGLFAKRRMLLLTDKPRLIYIDPIERKVMGEIPWTSDMFPQYKNMTTFFIHTPARTYYLEDIEKQSLSWVDMITNLLRA